MQLNGASGGVQIGVDQTTANLLYQDFMNNSQVPSGNTGNVAAGIAGTLSPQYLAAVQEMIDDLRWMAGDPGTITLDPTLNANAQDAALIDSEKDTIIEDGLPSPVSVPYDQVTAIDFFGRARTLLSDGGLRAQQHLRRSSPGASQSAQHHDGMGRSGRRVSG